MDDMKSRNIFTIIKNNWRRNPTAEAWTEESSYETKKHGDAYQSSYANFAVKPNPTQQIFPESPERKEFPKNKLSDIFYQYCTEATIHGVRHLSPSTNKIRRFVYLVLVLVLTGFLLNLLIRILISYTENPYKTDYYARVMKTMDFPLVTVCNIEGLDFEPDMHLNNTTLAVFFENSISRSITIEECFYNLYACNNTWPTVMLLRKNLHGCFTIRAAGNLTFDINGFENEGLYVDLLTTKNHQFGERGVQVFLHEDNTDPNEMASSFFAGPKDVTYASIQSQQVVKLGHPYHDLEDDCRPNDLPNFKNPLKYFKIYSKTNCQRECTGDFIRDVCNCSLPFFPGEASGKQCTFNELLCVLRNNEKSTSQETYINRCKCTPNCSFLHYESRISVARMQYKDLSNDKDPKKRKKIEDELRVRISFDKMVMTFMKEKPLHEINSLLASFGGQMSLFLGASVISIYELLEFSLMYLWPLLLSKFRKEEPKTESAGKGVTNEPMELRHEFDAEVNRKSLDPILLDVANE